LKNSVQKRFINKWIVQTELMPNFDLLNATHMKKITLHKSERLCSHKIIEELFDAGGTCLVYPIKLVFMKTVDADQVLQVAFAVSKRNFKHAVKRNILKRRMREAFRLNKVPVIDELAAKNLHVALMFVFIGKDESTYQMIEKSTILALKKMMTKI
jgi:ribonuclease P protein component